MTKILEGIYSTQGEAMAAIDRLKEQGYSRSDISVVANTEVHGNFLTVCRVLIEEEPPTTAYTEDLGANPRDVIDRTHEYDPDRDSLL